jgi:hypothetical protein
LWAIIEAEFDRFADVSEGLFAGASLASRDRGTLRYDEAILTGTQHDR